MIFGRIWCFFKGHSRGKLVGVEGGYNIFACPRCGNKTKYKHKPASVVQIQKAG